MADERKQASTIVAIVEWVFIPVMGTLAAPIRTFYLAIGHATVASWALVSIAGFASTWLYANMVERLNTPGAIATVEQKLVSIERDKLYLVEKAAELQALGVTANSWDYAIFNMDAGTQTVSFTFSPLPDPTDPLLSAQRVLLQVINRSGGQTLQAHNIPAPDVDGFVTVGFTFDASWSPGDELIISASQEFANGGRARWQQGGRVEVVPEAPGP